MSDALEKVAGITELPIFPLPLVLLPNEIVPLHIFEPRYRQMLVDLPDYRNMFGVSMFEPGLDAPDRPPFETIGCVAEIREAEPLDDGRSNILVIGVVRYRVVEYVYGLHEYLLASVDFFEDDPFDAETVPPIADEVFVLFERMANAAFRLSGSRGRFPEIQQTDPESLSFLITAAFNFENEVKYRLLAMTSTADRLIYLKEVLEKAVVQVEQSADINTVARTNGHSKKKIDF